MRKLIFVFFILLFFTSCNLKKIPYVLNKVEYQGDYRCENGMRIHVKGYVYDICGHTKVKKGDNITVVLDGRIAKYLIINNKKYKIIG